MRRRRLKQRLLMDIAKELNRVGVPFVRADYASMQQGSPSFLVFRSPANHPEARGVAIAIKHPRKKESKCQGQWWNLVNAWGLRLAIVFDEEDFSECMARWGFVE